MFSLKLKCIPWQLRNENAATSNTAVTQNTGQRDAQAEKWPWGRKFDRRTLGTAFKWLTLKREIVTKNKICEKKGDQTIGDCKMTKEYF